MTRTELIRWANDPAQRENVIAEAVRELIGEREMLSVAMMGLRGDIANATGSIKRYDAECSRLRAATLKPDPWTQNEEVPE